MGAADGAVFSRNRVGVDGFEVVYLRGGRGQPLLYLHGMGGAGRWESYHIAFANDTLTYAPQLPGWQDWELPSGIRSIEDYVELVLRFLDAVEVKDVTLVGHSIGGWIALRLAASHPERVSRLIVVDGLGLDTADAPAVNLASLDEEEFGKRLLAKLGTIATAQPYGFGAEFTNTRTSPEFERQWRGLGLVKKLTGDHCWDPDLPARLGRISAETLIVWGAQDGIAPAAHAQIVRDGIPNAHLVMLDGVGHLPMVERREAFHRICHDFVVGAHDQTSGVLET